MKTQHSPSTWFPAPQKGRRGLRLSSGVRCSLRRPALPGVQNYYLVALPGSAVGTRDIEELYLVAHRIGRMMGRRRFGDAECYTLMYSGARTRRRPWPHVHVLVAGSVADKRRNIFFLQMKHLLRWRRWPFFQWALGVA